ncbi:uncharacterized protein LOC106138151 [Amyelois transitella]|uniref:uncharacterized protein LOC106138151 n=1 Tax=Amyelois transitella TaxID=680683 RepID=UPI00298FA6F2|nr:uncharacterized protein LOC106138151 [Amyelois transitella]XP_060807757.1 uncharacterized protein LOC106138151 [Amyelois transitella]XP_060807762.1 uncharacterized protein LOC106138151 [Amyelois transitella]
MDTSTSLLVSTSQKFKYSKEIICALDAIFVYPKLVIIEDNRTIRILDLIDIRDKDVDAIRNKPYDFDNDILDSTLSQNNIWVILKTGEIFVIDLNCGSCIKVFIENHQNLKFHQIESDGSNIFLVNEDGECFSVSLITEDFNENPDNSIETYKISVKRSNFRRTTLEALRQKPSIYGLDLYLSGSDILLRCPMTGLERILPTNKFFEHVVPWGNTAVLVDKSGMYIIDLEDAGILYEFGKNEGYYYPVGSYENIFYYILWDDKEVYLCTAWNSTTEPFESFHNTSCLNSTTSRLSSEEALKQQLQNLIEVTTLDVKPNEVIAQVGPLFEKIKDFHFLLKYAKKLCQINIAFKLLLYPLQVQIYSAGDQDLIYQISDLIIKVDLLEYIKFRGNSYYEDTNLYEQTFRELCILFIKKSDLDLASICWLKYTEMKLALTHNDIIDIIDSIPHNIKLGALIIWLKNFVPSLLDNNPFFIDLFVKWTMIRVFELEKSGYWPKIGLKFIEEITNVLESSLKTVTIRPISMDDLDILKDHINHIIELKEKYRINMLLAELSSLSPNEVALIMLHRCYTEDMELFLQNYLPPYTSRHFIDMDDTLRTFIESEAASSGGGVDGTRLKILLNSFRSTTTRLDCLLKVLKVLDVPWSDTVVDLAVVAAASATKDFTMSEADCTLAQEIQIELKYANVKVVLKKYNFPLSCTDYMIVLHKIVSAQVVNLQDLRIIINVMTLSKNYGHVLYIVRCLQDNDTTIALDYFNTLENNEKKLLLKAMMSKYEQVISLNLLDNVKIERNYLDFLKGTKMLNIVQISDLENIYHLKNSYNITLCINTIYKEDVCNNECTAWNPRDGYSTSTVTRLTQTNKPSHFTLLSLLRRSSTSHTVRNLIENLITHFTLEGYSNTGEFVLSIFKDGENSSLLLNSIDILVELASNCAEEHLHYLVNILCVMNALQNANIILKNLSVVWKFHYIFLPMSSHMGINNLIDFYANFSHRSICLSSLYTERCDFTPFNIIASILGIYTQTNNVTNMDFIMIKNKIVKKLLHKLVCSQEIDELLLTALLIILSKCEANDDSYWLLEILQGQTDSLSPAIMTYLTCPLIRRTFALDNIAPTNKMPYRPQYILKSKFNINLAEVVLPDSSEETWDVKVIAFYVLRQYPNTSFERLVELCRALDVSLNDGLSLQLISILTSWELKYKVMHDELNCQQIYYENDEKEITEKCLVIWNNISNKEFLKDILTDFWRNGEVTLHGRMISVNPYFYEVYLCIYRLLFGSSVELRNKKEYFLLNFLKTYRRSSTPKQYEYELFSVKGMFPEIGNYRLPFQLFMREDMWSNLKSEITLETYERWLLVVALLALDPDLQTSRDMICSNALKQTMTARKRSDSLDSAGKETEPWRLTTREEPLLRAAHRCVKHIANMEWAGACLFYVLQGCARGADQVAAAQLCYQFAQRWAALQPGNRAVKQMERLHATLSTRHALHKIDWACEEFVRLSTEPAQLIRAMYLHPEFVEKMNRHDVNRAANEIADKNAINISSIRIQILENLLDKTQEKKSKTFLGLDTKELMTAKYILKATCPKMGAIYLSRIAFDDESDHNKRKKLRALQCLMSVVDSDTAVKVTNKERGEWWTSLLELICIVNLENIDMPWVVATFVLDKMGALEQLLQSVGTNVDGLKIAAELARRYGNTKIICKLISLLLHAGLYEEIIPLLLKVSSPPNDILCTAWRAILLSPFQHADHPITEKQRAKCLNVINLLPICPVIKDEDLKEIWKHCVRCKCFGMGCLVLPYMTSEMRQSLIELQKIDKRNLIASLKNLQSETYLISGAMFVLENLPTKSYR